MRQERWNKRREKRRRSKEKLRRRKRDRSEDRRGRISWMRRWMALKMSPRRRRRRRRPSGGKKSKRRKRREKVGNCPGVGPKVFDVMIRRTSETIKQMLHGMRRCVTFRAQVGIAVTDL